MVNDFSKLEPKHFKNGKNFDTKMFQSYKNSLIEMTDTTRSGSLKMWKVLGIASGVVAVFMLVLRIIDGESFAPALSTAIFSGVFLGVIFLLPPIYIIFYLTKFRGPVKMYREKMNLLGVSNADFKEARRNMMNDRNCESAN